jgi:hypothetical protein
MNPDLEMGGELLKKMGPGNLFMVFGEPDIDARPTEDGQLTLEIRGLDIYDPTTGLLRSSSVDDIAAWFLDTDYDGDAFFVWACVDFHIGLRFRARGDALSPSAWTPDDVWRRTALPWIGWL